MSSEKQQEAGVSCGAKRFRRRYWKKGAAPAVSRPPPKGRSPGVLFLRIHGHGHEGPAVGLVHRLGLGWGGRAGGRQREGAASRAWRRVGGRAARDGRRRASRSLSLSRGAAFACAIRDSLWIGPGMRTAQDGHTRARRSRGGAWRSDRRRGEEAERREPRCARELVLASAVYLTYRGRHHLRVDVVVLDNVVEVRRGGREGSF